MLHLLPPLQATNYMISAIRYPLSLSCFLPFYLSTFRTALFRYHKCMYIQSPWLMIDDWWLLSVGWWLVKDHLHRVSLELNLSNSKPIHNICLFYLPTYLPTDIRCWRRFPPCVCGAVAKILVKCIIFLVVVGALQARPARYIDIWICRCICICIWDVRFVRFVRFVS